MSDGLNIPDSLIDLQRASDAAREGLAGLSGNEWDAQWRTWRDAAGRAQEAITEHATAISASRYEVEAAVKKAARHTAPETE
ncbi:hypothetical protein ABZ419_11650 [Streptomyces cinnamoneus]|uniref:hypothetical protein n=1 Tax=Streptomyces cinnamoneus TaxID=53446 RepID=UPI0033DBD108